MGISKQTYNTIDSFVIILIPCFRNSFQEISKQTYQVDDVHSKDKRYIRTGSKNADEYVVPWLNSYEIDEYLRLPKKNDASFSSLKPGYIQKF
jgi:putative methionine-R-sulfoxide reductase with GAF domain